jgi:hypothetical protein
MGEVGKLTHGRPSAHFPLMVVAMDVFAAWTLEFTI